MKRLLAATAFVLTSAIAFAHQDTILALARDGSILDLPEQYQPAELRLDFQSGDDGKRLAAATLVIGKNITELPACIVELINTESQDTVRITSSWYHDEGLLPPYINFHFADPGFDPESWDNPGYSILFNMETAKVLQLTHARKSERGRIKELLLDVRTVCSGSDDKQLNRFYEGKD